MTIEIKYLWLEEKDCQGISSFDTKLENLRDEENGGRWKLDIESKVVAYE